MLGAADRAASDSLSLRAPPLPNRGCGLPMTPPLPHLKINAPGPCTLNGCRGATGLIHCARRQAFCLMLHPVMHVLPLET